MLLFPEFMPEKYYTQEKKIHTATDSWMRFDGFPGLLHFRAPVDIIKHQNGVIFDDR